MNGSIPSSIHCVILWQEREELIQKFEAWRQWIDAPCRARGASCQFRSSQILMEMDRLTSSISVFSICSSHHLGTCLAESDKRCLFPEVFNATLFHILDQFQPYRDYRISTIDKSPIHRHVYENVQDGVAGFSCLDLGLLLATLDTQCTNLLIGTLK